MAYNLPDAWDPGYVLPENVVDEGLERRAFVTKWLPRGTYDNPPVGPSGYVLPDYVKREGIGGQGTYTTKWQPSGTYNGPRIPHWLNQRPQVVKSRPLPGGGREVTVQPLGDAPMPEPYESYGQKAAQALLSRVATLPRAQQGSALKAILDKVDKSAWSRMQDIWQRYRKQGINPVQALPMALARAMSAGILAEIIRTGVRGEAPQANSLLGLGCYGCLAVLGADDDCTTTAGFQWVYGVPGVPGHWQRTPAGQQDVPFCPSGPPSGAPSVTTAPPTIRDDRTIDDWFVGPFGFNTKTFVPRVWAIGTPSATTANRVAAPDLMYLSPDPDFVVPRPNASYVRPILPEVLAWLRARLTEEKDANGEPDVRSTYGSTSGDQHASSFLFDADGNVVQGQLDDAKRWFDALGIQPGDTVRFHPLWNLKTGGAPFAKTKHIKTGEDMVLHVRLSPVNALKPWSTTNPLVLKVWLSTVPDKNIFGALWNPMILINPLTALKATASVASGIGNELTSLACDVLSHPAAGTVAGAAAAAYGIPPQAGTTGVAIAADQCGKAPPPPPVTPPHHPLMPLAILAGGGLLATVLILHSRKKKKKTP